MKKGFLFFTVCFISSCVVFTSLYAQAKVENVVIVTLDGMRWQEIFGGMDSAIVNMPKFNQDSKDEIVRRYWSDNIVERRKKLMPFFWTTIAKKGRLYGNRRYGNNVNVSNPYRVSYPGYSEIFCGYVDTTINSNKKINNPNINFLEFLNGLPVYKNKIAAFGAWSDFPYILNAKRNNLPVVSAFDSVNYKLTENEELIRVMLMQSFKPFGEEECLDVFTHFQAMEYMKARKPKVLYIAYGETDEWAHAGRYKYYLNAASIIDQWIGEIWNYIQTDAFYANKTLLFITTDHGRGEDKERWTDHNKAVKGADETWFAVMGPGIHSSGEMKNKGQWYHKQFAVTLTNFLGVKFVPKDKDAQLIEIE